VLAALDPKNGMRNCNVRENHPVRRVRLITCVIVLAVAFMVTPPLRAQADRVTPPAVPANIQVPAGSRAFLAGHAVGTQDYVCLPSGTGFAWTFFAPQATLFTDDDRQVITHFLSPDRSRVAYLAPPGGTPATRAPSGERRWLPPQTPPSSRETRFPGF
jgi:hypothetical protein